MFLAAHAATGAVIQKSGGSRWWAWAPLAVASHWFLDRANWYQGHLWHGSPEANYSLQADLWGIFVVAMNLLVVALLAWKCRQYWKGMVLACIIDLDHVISPLFGQHQWFHTLMWSSWFSTEWSVFLQAAFVALAVAMVLPRIQVRVLFEAPQRLKGAVVRLANGINGHRAGTTDPCATGDERLS